MSIRESRVYLSDRGVEFDVDEMQSSHILNVLNHHHDQLGVLSAMQDKYPDNTHIAKRISNMERVITILELELASRDPDKDMHRESSHPHDSLRGYMGDYS